MTDNCLDLRLEDFLDLSASESAPGAGSAAALTIALAALLVIKVAHASRDSWAEASGVAAQARELQHRCPTLAREDADAWQRALEALDAGPDSGAGELARRLDRAADLPLAIAETGADVAGLAQLAAERGEGNLRGEAVAAAILAEAGVRASAHLVVINLKAATDDDRRARAGRAERAAAGAVGRALEVER